MFVRTRDAVEAREMQDVCHVDDALVRKYEAIRAYIPRRTPNTRMYFGDAGGRGGNWLWRNAQYVAIRGRFELTGLNQEGRQEVAQSRVDEFVESAAMLASR